MLIFPNAYLAAEAAQNRPLTRARIGYQTWTRDLLAAAVTASTDSDDGPKDSPLTPDTYTFWEPTALPATWVVDLGTGRDVDYVGLVHTLGSSGCAVTVETSDGSVAGSPSAQVWEAFGDPISPGTDDPLMFLDSSRTCRYVRLTITGGSTMPRISVVNAGEVLAMQRAIYGGHNPITLSRDTVLYRALSEGAQFLGQGFRSHGLVGGVSFRYLEPDWYRENFDPFVQAARSYPFFFAWRPSSYPLEVAYAWALEDIHPSNMGVKDFMQVAFNMHGIGHQ